MACERVNIFVPFFMLSLIYIKIIDCKYSGEKGVNVDITDRFLDFRACLSERIADIYCNFLPVGEIMLYTWWQVKAILFKNVLQDI